MYIKRNIEKVLKKTITNFPVLGLIGPRQSGKTTVLKTLFPNYEYVNLEDIEAREFAKSDPKGFLDQYKAPLIIDEAQRAPNLFSQIQVVVDENKKMGSYILSGSQNFLLMNQISQSLAGRISIHTLLPLSLSELSRNKKLDANYKTHIFNGQYPRRYENKKISSHEFYNSYLSTYVERDIRQLINVTNLSVFQRFLKLLAGRIGQELNFTSLAQDVGITHNTAKSWVSILETSYVVFQLPPYYKNFNKRLVKSSKIYFYDTGLASWLLNIDNISQLDNHFAIGGLFENLIVSEYLKSQYNSGKRPRHYFWRDQQKREVDLIIDNNKPIAIEIKAGKTISSDYFKNLKYLNNLSDEKIDLKVIYGGESEQNRSNIKVLPWNKMAEAWNKT